MLPATSPVTDTAMVAPGPRGADPRTATTVARLNPVPAAAHARSSGAISRTAGPPGRRWPRDERGQRLEGLQRVAGHELVNVWQRRGHPAGHRLEAGPAGPGVGPDHPVRQAVQPGH